MKNIIKQILQFLNKMVEPFNVFTDRCFQQTGTFIRKIYYGTDTELSITQILADKIIKRRMRELLFYGMIAYLLFADVLKSSIYAEFFSQTSTFSVSTGVLLALLLIILVIPALLDMLGSYIRMRTGDYGTSAQEVKEIARELLLDPKGSDGDSGAGSDRRLFPEQTQAEGRLSLAKGRAA